MRRTVLEPAALEGVVESNLAELLAALAHAPGVKYAEELDHIRFVSGIPHPLLNAILRARLSADDVDAGIDRLLQHFTSRGLPMCWYTGPSTQPADLGARLKNHGLTHAEDMPGMVVDLQGLDVDLPCPPGLAIERVEDQSALVQWLRPLSVGFELPDVVTDGFGELFTAAGLGPDAPFRHYLGWLRSEPVVCSTLFRGAQVAGIYDVAAIPEVRRQGFGTAITLAALREASSLGYRHAVLFSTRIGYGVYRRLGFQECCTLGLYLLSDTASV